MKGTFFQRYAVFGCCTMLAMLVLQADAALSYRLFTLTGARTGDEGLATQAYVGYPTGVVLDAAGSIYVAEFNRQTIRRIDANGIIHRVAGTGNAGFAGDGGPATQARIDGPQSLALDAEGALYIADANNNRVRKIDSSGVITTVAGNGSSVSAGDGGSAREASLHRPYGLAFDAEGNLYVSERFGHRIRKIATDGTITTVAGIGTAGFSGDAGAAIDGQFNEPASLGFDAAGNLYVADSRNDRVRRISPDGTLSTVMYEPWSIPYAIAVSGDGTLYVSDTNCSLIRVSAGGTSRIAGGDYSCTYKGDGGWAVNAPVDISEGLALSSSGDLYVSDSGNYRLRRIRAGVIEAVAGVGGHVDGDSSVATFSAVMGLSVGPDGTAYVADTYPNNRVRRVSKDGITSTIAGLGYMAKTGDGGPATAAGLSYPIDTVVDGIGRVYIVDRVNNRIRRVGTDGIITTVAGDGTASGYSGDGGLATQTKLNRPRAVAVAPDASFYIADERNHRIRRVGVDGIISTVAGTGVAGFAGDGGLAMSAVLNSPQSIALDGAGNLYICDYGNARIRKIAPDGTISTYAGTGTLGSTGLGGPATQAQLDRTTGIAVDSLGRLYLAGGSLRVIDLDGTMRQVGGVDYPAQDVAVGQDDTIYIGVLGGRVLRGRRIPMVSCATTGEYACFKMMVPN